MTGFDLLEFRPLEEEINFKPIEDNYKITLPPIYKNFLSSFLFKKNLNTDRSFFYYPNLSSGEISFPFKDIYQNLESTIGTSDDEIIEQKLILIATSRYGFYIGTIGNQTDKIFTRDYSLNNSLISVANNIFEFLRGVTNNLKYSAKTEKQYRKFMIDIGYDGEDLELEIMYWKNYKKNQP